VLGGVTNTEEVIIPPGDHTKAPPPIDGVAINVVDPPSQTVSLFTVTVGAGVTVTVPGPVAGVQSASV
jgi:hypothetical protein